MGLGNVGAVFLFEWRRSLTVARLLWWLVLTLFPTFIVLLIRFGSRGSAPPEIWTFLFFALIPMLVSMLGTFLWATPTVSAELEQKSWVYLAVRPHGSTAVVVGKYLAAVLWVLAAALLGLAIAVAIAPTDESGKIAWTIGRLVFLSCPAYAAVYLVIGALFPKRSMAIAVAYTLIFELVVSFIPAVINELTVQYRLRALLVDWADVSLGDAPGFVSMMLAGNASATWHVTVLAIYTCVLIFAAILLIRWREFSTADESDV